MKTDELREKYLAFFQTKGHTMRPSDVLVPHGDPSVLFTPAGMNPFKDHFLGKVKLEFTRATTCQKCLRTGDIDNVGRTAYHHTLFEMLGNFSFGDYFKREAIHWAWEFLTKKEWMGIDPNRLTVTVYLDDDEAADIWHKEIGLATNRINRMGEDDNFWPAGSPTNGPDGVCGPCSEIFYHGDKGGEVEIWNLVFTQFNRVGNPPNNLRPLPSKNIDTGMGLERIASVMQGVETNYHIDILLPIVKAAAEITGRHYEAKTDDGRRLRRITDHIRACTFALHENVEPGPKGRNYVIRRLLRRAILDGHQMGMREPFLYQLVAKVAEMMGRPYPELHATVDRVAEEIKAEESYFLNRLDGAMANVEKVFKEMDASGKTIVAGEDAAHLYTTYGVPPELFQQIAAEKSFTFDWTGFKSAMEKHGVTSGSGGIELFKTGAIEDLKGSVRRTDFVGYESTEATATLRGIVLNDIAQPEFSDTSEEEVILVLDKTPFYGESGGQVGDTGIIKNGEFEFEVRDTQKNSELFLHFGKLLKGTMKAGATVTASVDVKRRDALRRAHSATHILHYALQKNLGENAQQRGSKVEADQFRFDFKTRDAVAADVLQVIESDVVTKIQAAAPVKIESLPIEEARQRGAMMLFGERYPDIVRLVSIGDFSKELCGGTHAGNSKDIGGFEVVAEEAVTSGTRRIVAVTGEKAAELRRATEKTAADCAAKLGTTVDSLVAGTKGLVELVRDLRKAVSSGTKPTATTLTVVKGNGKSLDYSATRATVRDVARMLNVSTHDVASRIDGLLAEVESLNLQLNALSGASEVSADSLLESATTIGKTKVVAVHLPISNGNLMRQLVDQIRRKVESAAVFLATQEGDKASLVCGVTPDIVDRVKAGDIVKATAPIVGGGGGGRADMAQAGGKDPSQLPAAVAAAKELMVKALS